MIILPNHSCPVVNLSDELCAVSTAARGGAAAASSGGGKKRPRDEEGVTLAWWRVLCRGAPQGPASLGLSR